MRFEHLVAAGLQHREGLAHHVLGRGLRGVDAADHVGVHVAHVQADDLRALPEAEVVQHDALWRQRLTAWLAFGERVVQVVAVLLGLGVLLVVGNTVRLDIGARSEEIAVLQHLGATDGFVRRPFLYLGAWYGLAAGSRTFRSSGTGIGMKALTLAPPVLPTGTHSRENSKAAGIRNTCPTTSFALRSAQPTRNIHTWDSTCRQV